MSYSPLKYEPAKLNISEVRPYTAKELCKIYGISDKTFVKWLQPFKEQVGDKQGRFYTVWQVQYIFEKLGIPYSIKVNDY